MDPEDKGGMMAPHRAAIHGHDKVLQLQLEKGPALGGKG
jgi:hypothetical protein